MPISVAETLLEALVSYAERVSSNSKLHDLREILHSQPKNENGISLLEAELRARRIPIRATLDALRAANLLPPNTSTQQGLGDIQAAHQEL